MIQMDSENEYFWEELYHRYLFIGTLIPWIFDAHAFAIGKADTAYTAKAERRALDDLNKKL